MLEKLLLALTITTLVGALVKPAGSLEPRVQSAQGEGVGKIAALTVFNSAD